MNTQILANASALPHEERILLTRAECARRYSMSIRSVDYLIQNGVIPKITIGEKFVRIPLREADKKMLSLGRAVDEGGGR